MSLVLVGLSHKTAPLDIREKLAVSNGDCGRVLNRLVESEDVQEALLISTCNRVEAFLISKHAQKAAQVAARLFAEISSLPEGELSRHLYTKDSEEAISHLFRVTAGMDSLVVGESQISGQVKEAFSLACSSGTSGPYLSKLVHKALSVSKRIRTETGIGDHPVSVSYVAVLLAEKIFGNLEETRVLLIGAGEMGTLAAKHLLERRVGTMWISNRTGERGHEIAAELGARVMPYEDVLKGLDQVDILITSTASTDFIIREEDMKEVMRRRKNRPMFLIDISVPRNIDPVINQLENVYLYDMDHLEGIVATNVKEREKEARRAEGIIAHEVRSFVRYMSQMEFSPTIQQLSKKFDKIRTREVEKYLARKPGATDKEKEEIESCTRAIVNKILHEPIILMKTEENTEGAPRYSEILKKMFRLE